MRLARPVYESLPLIYATVGAFAVFISYVDQPGARAAATFTIGLAALIAALTLYLRRRGYREMRREYSGGDLATPASASTITEQQFLLDLGATRDSRT